MGARVAYLWFRSRIQSCYSEHSLLWPPTRSRHMLAVDMVPEGSAMFVALHGLPCSFIRLTCVHLLPLRARLWACTSCCGPSVFLTDLYKRLHSLTAQQNRPGLKMELSWENRCGNSDCEITSTMRCAHCKNIKYSSEACQREDCYRDSPHLLSHTQISTDLTGASTNSSASPSPHARSEQIRTCGESSPSPTAIASHSSTRCQSLSAQARAPITL